MKKIIVISCLLFIFLVACKNIETPSTDELLKVEKAFSDMSVEKGMVKAFTCFCHDEGVLLRPDSYPVVGKDAVADLIANTPDSLFTLTWEPLYARIAESGELGYTYGIYTLEYKDSSLEPNKGTYLTIWVKNENGDWRFVMDSGQDGLGD